MKNTKEIALSHVGAAYNQVHHSEYSRILRLCSLLLSNLHEAEEVTQEVFRLLIHAQAVGNAAASWDAWLTTVAVNACRDRRRSAWRKWWRRRQPERLDLALSVAENTLEEQPLSSEGQTQVWGLLDSLSPRQREVFVLRRLERLSIDDAAKVLGLSSRGVKRHLFHAMCNILKGVRET